MKVKSINVYVLSSEMQNIFNPPCKAVEEPDRIAGNWSYKKRQIDAASDAVAFTGHQFLVDGFSLNIAALHIIFSF